MKFDTIIIGGGLSGLTCGIKLAEKGKHVAIISTGQSALHFSSGSFELMSTSKNPLEAIKTLPDTHPYKKIGADNIESLACEAQSMLQQAGVEVSGNPQNNHLHLTPLGKLKHGWLTLNDYLTFENLNELKGQKAEIINIKAYTDFYPEYIGLGLRKLEVSAKYESVTISELEQLRKNSTEMRATNIARTLEGESLEHFAAELNRTISPTSDFAIIPAVIGLTSYDPVIQLRNLVKCPIYFIPTMPSSVPGVRTQLQLVHRFEQLGGRFMLGDTVTDGTIIDNRLINISTSNLGEESLSANHYVMATGSFFSKGLKSNFEKVYEPIFDLNVNYLSHRSDWYNDDSYSPQPYMNFGVETDQDFKVKQGDSKIENLYAIGSLIGGCNALTEGSGAGVAMLSAIRVANQICEL